MVQLVSFVVYVIGSNYLEFDCLSRLKLCFTGLFWKRAVHLWWWIVPLSLYTMAKNMESLGARFSVITTQGIYEHQLST